MIEFPAQFNGINTNVVGDRIVKFRVDESYSSSIEKLFSKKIGTEYVVVLVPTVKETEEENYIDTTDKFNKKMHALIHNLSELTGKKDKEIKDSMKEYLKQEHLIKESTKELDLKGFAIACNWLEKQLNNGSE